MSREVVIYYHDSVEVDPSTSWTGLDSTLKSADRVNITSVTDPRVTELFDYARPDAVITVNGKPVVSIEQTQMNPSGHNIPQRFSFQVRAAELGVPSILYYPEYSRRTFSDPNVRYLQVRVPLAQRRLSSIYGVPALSLFWPTDDKTLLPDMRRDAHQEMADVVAAIVANDGQSTSLLTLEEIKRSLENMELVISKYARGYDRNPSVRDVFPDGFNSARTRDGTSVDPPIAARLTRTSELLASIPVGQQGPNWQATEKFLSKRDYSLVFTGTSNQGKTDSEHPWPGYLSLLDVLYLRTDAGISARDREHNLVYVLPVAQSVFIARMNQSSPPTATYIADCFADLIRLERGAVPGRTIRDGSQAIPCMKW